MKPDPCIEERLRAASRDERLSTGALYAEAATEIERLRTETVRCRGCGRVLTPRPDHNAIRALWICGSWTCDQGDRVQKQMWMTEYLATGARSPMTPKEADVPDLGAIFNRDSRYERAVRRLLIAARTTGGSPDEELKAACSDLEDIREVLGLGPYADMERDHK